MYIFYHIYTVNNWEQIVNEQINRLVASGLYDYSKKYAFVVGDKEELDKRLFGWTILPSKSENDTLRQIQSIIPNTDVSLYFHTKGVTRKDKYVRDWRKYLEYYVIDKWEQCVESLQNYDCAGVNYWFDHKHPHFSGNFWWATNKYLKTLNPVDDKRENAEFWIGTGNPKVKVFNQLSNAYYTTPCPENLYKTRLSVLITSINKKGIRSLLNKLYKQAKNKDVEILTLTDNKWQTIGRKRQKLLEIAQGDYICFVDDDDDISNDYINTILNGIKNNPEVFVFGVDYYHNGRFIKSVRYNKNFIQDINLPEFYLRIPNHIMVVKRNIALQAGFENKNWQEDVGYSKRLKLTIQAKTNKTLYKYMHAYKHKPVDIIILSNAKSREYKDLTLFTLQSLSNAMREISYNVIVMEQNPEIDYDVKTIHYTEKFNYNRLMNKGFKETNSDIIIFANNDLEYSPYWLENLIEVMDKYALGSASPICRIREPNRLFVKDVVIGNIPGKTLLGHCIAVRRNIFEIIGGFDEDVSFWASENTFSEQIKRIGAKHGLATNSRVTHIGGNTKGLTLRNDPNYEELTTGQLKKYTNKYGKSIF